jgi:hypothetical protein
MSWKNSFNIPLIVFQALTLSLLFGIFWRFPDVRFDSPTYLVLKQESLFNAASWNGYRTMGYPIFLKLATAVNPSGDMLPVFQFIVHVAAVFVFFFGMRSITKDDSAATVAASALLWSEFILEDRYTHVLTDFIGLSAAIATIGFLLLVASKRRKRDWFCYSLVLFLTYQIRPVYIFMIPFCPMLALLLPKFIHERLDSKKPTDTKKFVFGVTIAAVLPFLIFCAARYIAFGQFNLVAFGGVNAIGIAGQLLKEEHVTHLTEDVAPLAQKIIETRSVLSSTTLQVERWKSPQDASGVSRTLLAHQYNFIIWDVATPLAEKMHGSAASSNKALASLSRQVFKLEPIAYLTWVAKSLRFAVSEIFLSKSFLATLLLFLLAAFIWTYKWLQTPETRRPQTISTTSLPPIILLSVIAMTFFFAKSLLVVLVEPAFTRYIFPATVFFPAVLAVSAFTMFSAVKRTGPR